MDLGETTTWMECGSPEEVLLARVVDFSDVEASVSPLVAVQRSTNLRCSTPLTLTTSLDVCDAPRCAGSSIRRKLSSLESGAMLVIVVNFAVAGIFVIVESECASGWRAERVGSGRPGGWQNRLVDWRAGRQAGRPAGYNKDNHSLLCSTQMD